MIENTSPGPDCQFLNLQQTLNFRNYFYYTTFNSKRTKRSKNVLLNFIWERNKKLDKT